MKVHTDKPSLDGLLTEGWLHRAAWEVKERFERRGVHRVGEYRLRTSPAKTARRLGELIDREQWVPRQPKVVNVRKRSGGRRLLIVLGPEEQVVHAALGAYLGQHIDPQFLPCSWGFRPRRSVAAAVSRASGLLQCGQRWAADLDIRDCFGTIRHDLLLERLGEFGVDEDDLVRLLRQVVRRSRPGVAPPGVALGQGSPLSPLLANVYLHPVDVAMSALCGYQRYADDLVCLCSDRQKAVAAWEQMLQGIRRGGQEPSPAKSGVREVAPGWTLLGSRVGDDGRLHPNPRDRSRPEQLDSISKRYRRRRSRPPHPPMSK